jgi:hypothetical protein
MTASAMTTPVALMVFNRPEITSRVFQSIREARPSRLLLVADGPRPGRGGESERCAEVRRIIGEVDWPCEVSTNFSEVNLGCGLRMATGIDWVFEQVEEAIILEDDCLPHPSFFRYCEELLERYRDDARVMHIAGNNSRIAGSRSEFSYYFSRYTHCWGWATWRRAWRCYDFGVARLDEAAVGARLRGMFPRSHDLRGWLDRFRQVHDERVKHTWDYQWTFACWINGGLSILPNQNLISNVGFGPDATHTKDSDSSFACLPVGAMEFPLRHPPIVGRDVEADERAQQEIFTTPKWRLMLTALKRLVQRATRSVRR